MVTAVEKICHILNKTFMVLGTTFLVIVLLASSTQVFTRYILNASLTGTEELARYAFLWMSMLGAAICVGKWAHPSVSVLIDVLNEKWQKILSIFLNLLIMSFSLIFIIDGFKLVNITMDQRSPTLLIPMFLIYLCVPVGGLGIFINAIGNIMTHVNEFTVKHEPEEFGKDEEVDL